MSSPDPLQDYGCEYWQEIEDEDGMTHEYCRYTHKQCSCSGMATECDNGQFIPQIIDEPHEPE